MNLLRDRRLRHLPSFQTPRDREIRDFMVTAVLLGAIIFLGVVTLADLLAEEEVPQLRSTVGRITTGSVRDAG